MVQSVVCPLYHAYISHSACSTYVLFHCKNFSDFSKGLTVFVQCLLFQTPFSWPVSTTISMINNIYYKCTLCYAFYEAFKNPWSLKHAFQLKFHLSQNNMKIITLQHEEKKKKDFIFQ